MRGYSAQQHPATVGSDNTSITLSLLLSSDRRDGGAKQPLHSKNRVDQEKKGEAGNAEFMPLRPFVVLDANFPSSGDYDGNEQATESDQC